MCYSNCPGENWEGCCVRPSIQGTPQAHCYDGGENETEGEGREMARFPRTKFVKTNTINEQMPVIAGELREVYECFMEPTVDYHHVAVELNDIIQAAETALEILKEQKGVDIDQAAKDMLQKNRERGYYEK